MAWTFDSLKVGDKDFIQKVITAEMVDTFADLSEDHNPVHVDEAFAKTTPFGRRIAHGMLTASLISAVLGIKIPGNGSIYMGQSIRFKAPVFLGDKLTVWAEVKEKIEEKERVVMTTWAENAEGVVVLEGEALLLFRR
ncbi:MAG: MaoC family dehydratase [Enterobacteriaceae bacterium]|jgi:3-hydroxybutyryl-CoA dehydratase|nr:MaoC family dehydratase [Enterobacteriaceae bacterium]